MATTSVQTVTETKGSDMVPTATVTVVKTDSGLYIVNVAQSVAYVDVDKLVTAINAGKTAVG